MPILAESSVEGLFVFILIAVIIWAIRSHRYNRDARKVIERAQKKYWAGLRDLMNDPDNPDLRMEVLELGRDYAWKVRRYGQGLPEITLFDEVALMNDINAACAGAGKKRRERDKRDGEPS